MRLDASDRSRPTGVWFGAWAAASFRILAAFTWPLVVLAPRVSTARRIARSAARLWIAMTRIPLRTEGLELLPRDGRPCVIVANHTSKLDAIALSAALPISFGFVAKIELERNPWLRWPLHRLGVLFVRRDHLEQVPSQTGIAIERLDAGDSLLWFPEGTFKAQPGLLPFHSGAFVAAAHARVPVIPVAVRGLRELRPAERGFLQRGAIELRVGTPLEPPGGEPAAAALVLHAQARSFLAAHCGEPDLAG